MLLVTDKTNKLIVERSKQPEYPKEYDWMTVDSENREVSYKDTVWYGDKEEILLGTTRYNLVTLATKKDILYHSTKMLRITVYIVLAALMIMAMTIIIGSIFFI